MNKKILAVLALAMVLVMAFAACKKNDKYEETDTTNGETTTAKKHVSIIAGPDDEGFFGEDIVDPNTGEKIEPSTNGSSVESNGGKTDGGSNNGTTGGNNGGSTSTKPSTETTTASPSVNVGGKPQQASIKWSDIKNA